MSFVTFPVDPTPNKPMAARTAADHQRLRETHELQLLNQAGQPQPRGRGQGQPVVRPPISATMSATGPPSSQQPSQNGMGDAAYNMPAEVQYFPLYTHAVLMSPINLPQMQCVLFCLCIPYLFFAIYIYLLVLPGHLS